MKKFLLCGLLISFCLLSGLSYAGKDNKVTICHIPPGDPDNLQTITVNENALEAHLSHGDSIGACQSGCQNDNVDCNDGNLCTSDFCLENGECEHVAVNCDDGNPCTLDLCMASTGCLNLPADDIPCDIPCDDKNPCTENDLCVDGTCSGIPVYGGCCILDNDCDDGNLCTTDLCLENTCINEEKDCSSDDVCSVGFCDPGTGDCTSTPVNCDDGNICTDEICDPSAGCVSQPTNNPPEDPEISCDGIDNDCDGQVDEGGVCNDPPVAVDDAVTTHQGGSVEINLTNNDYDPDGTIDPTTVTIVSSSSSGFVEINGDGTVVYTHNGIFNGSDSFTYTVQDDYGATSNLATVTIEVIPVNIPPVAVDDGVITSEDTFTINLINNDYDPDGTIDPTTITIVSPPSGILNINGDGTVTYTRNPPGFTGFDSFIYTVQDDYGATSNAATVTIQVL